MKKIKYLLLAVVAMVVCSCGVMIEELSEDVRNEIQMEYEKEFSNVHVSDFVLVHKDGNNYESVVDITADGETMRFALEVVWDGNAYTWETTPLY